MDMKVVIVPFKNRTWVLTDNVMATYFCADETCSIHYIATLLIGCSSVSVPCVSARANILKCHRFPANDIFSLLFRLIGLDSVKSFHAKSFELRLPKGWRRLRLIRQNWGAVSNSPETLWDEFRVSGRQRKTSSTLSADQAIKSLNNLEVAERGPGPKQSIHAWPSAIPNYSPELFLLLNPLTMSSSSSFGSLLCSPRAFACWSEVIQLNSNPTQMSRDHSNQIGSSSLDLNLMT
jgi:hypothetical protein